MYTSPEGELITVQEAADRLAVSRWMVYRLIWDQQSYRCRSAAADELSDNPSTTISPA